MWRTAVASILLLSCVGACGGSQSGTAPALAPGDVWIQDVTLISAERPMPLPHAHVVMRGGKIASAGIDSPGTAGPGVTVIAGAGKYLVPGLIDGHVHLAGVPGMSPEQEAAMPAAVAAYDRQLPRSYLYFGFTAVVDLNVVDRQRLLRLRAADVGPTVFDCGNALSLANGYPMSYVPAAIRFDSYPNFLYDPRQADAIPKKYSPQDHSPEAAVGRVASGGGVCVKAHYEPGFDPRAGKQPVPTVELMRQVREASTSRKLPLLLHANSLEAHRFAAEVRPDAVVHGMWNWGQESTGAELPTAVREVLDAERLAGIGMMPTSRVIGGLADLIGPAFLDDQQLTHVLPAQILSWYRGQDGQWFVREMVQGMGGLPPERARAIFVGIQTLGQRAAVYFAHGGGRILFGSDTPSAPTYANPPGYNGYLELRELESAGISPRQLLAAATVENAHLFGLADYGTIEPGKNASLLLLRDDPLKSTAAFDTIEMVMVNGRVIERRALSAQSR